VACAVELDPLLLDPLLLDPLRDAALVAELVMDVAACVDPLFVEVW
jgi:hypothetical protein